MRMANKKLDFTAKAVLTLALALALFTACGAGEESAAAPPEEAELLASVNLAVQNTWQSGGETFTQYDISISNHSDAPLIDWALHLTREGDVRIEQGWNSLFTTGEREIVVTPKDEHLREIAAGAQGVNIGGFICAGGGRISPGALYFQGGSELNLGGDGSQSANHDPAAGTTNPQTSTTPAGALHVEGTLLKDENGNTVQLRGVSTHGLAWFAQYVNYDAFKTLRDEWGANVIRLAMYTAEYGGYCTGGEREALKALIDDGVRYATDLGLYVIIDWHILQDQNPTQNEADALIFFSEMAEKYSSHTNVIYEICNEPQNSPFTSVIKPYAEKVIAAIRAQDENALILVGTNTWSQDIHEVAGNMLADGNTMYVMHFYAASHKDDLRARMQAAIDAGVPVFVSECSICDASGSGGVDYASADAWLKLMNDNSVSFAAWNLSNKDETSSLLKAGCTAVSGWGDDDLSETGVWFKAAISGAG